MHWKTPEHDKAGSHVAEARPAGEEADSNGGQDSPGRSQEIVKVDAPLERHHSQQCQGTRNADSPMGGCNPAGRKTVRSGVIADRPAHRPSQYHEQQWRRLRGRQLEDQEGV